jgi:radical SAM protein with 4Fe4S-binding SPASM domain
VQVSLDGPADVQDVQRPMANGTGSFAPLVANVRHLVAHNVPVTFRTTVTRLSVNSLDAIVRLASELGVGRVHFEPMFRTGRGLDDDLGPPDDDAYADALRAAFLLGHSLGVHVEASDLLALLPTRGTFCGACGANVIVAPSGRISTCAHVLDAADAAADTFLVGEVNRRDADFVYLTGRRERLQSRTVDRMAECGDCYLRLNCAGDCLIRAFRDNDGDIFSIRPAACDARRRTSAWAIAWVAEGGVPLGETATTASFNLVARTQQPSRPVTVE